jgi:hypothetical protein
MARPSRNNADYFTHDADLRNDRRIKAIRSEFGPAGYGIIIMLLEMLTDADHTQLCTDGVELDLLAGDLGVSVTEINSLLQLAERIGYFTRNEAGNLTCPDLNQALEPVFDKRNRSRVVAQTARERQSVTTTPVSVTETPQSKVKESKVKDTKVSKAKKPVDSVPRQFYRDNVSLTEKEYGKLVEEKGQAFTERCLDKLANYKLAHGKHYDSDYGAINSWVIKEISREIVADSASTLNAKPTAAPRPTAQTNVR